MVARREKMDLAARGIVSREGIFFHLADLPTFLGQLPTFSTVNAEKLIVHLPRGAKFSSPGDTRLAP